MPESHHDIAPDPQLVRLVEAHPLLFRGKAPRVFSYVSPGWYDLIDKLCSDIEEVLGTDGCKKFEVEQIKEKFGVLRFYWKLDGYRQLHVDAIGGQGHLHFVGVAKERGKAGAAQDSVAAQVTALVDATCEASETICETCGALAQLRKRGGWLTTRCDQCERQLRP